tara:strand:- start:13 stop:672 length:660 start_codon:yes stop_codon:yes gene_type:complete
MSDETDGFLAKIKALLESAPDVGPPAGHEQSVSFDRFHKVNETMKATRSGLESLTAEFTAYKATHAAALVKVQEDAGKSVTAVHNRYAENDTLRGMGLDADGANELRSQYGKLSDTDRPASPVEFWKSSLEAVAAHRADPEQVAAPALPKTLTPYLPAPPAPEPAPESASGRRGGVVIRRSNVDAGVQRGPSPTRAQRMDAAVKAGDAKAFQDALNGPA